MMEYKLVNDDYGNVSMIKLTDDNGKIKFIPFNEDNRHYQEYLEWVAEGNEPEPADE